MKLLIQIMDDDGKVLIEHTSDPCQPSQWRPQSGQRFVGKMPAQSDQQNTGTYVLNGFSFQPHLTVERPNGYRADAPKSVPAFPFNPTSLPQGAGKTFVPPWGPQNAPTISPQQNILATRG